MSFVDAHDFPVGLVLRVLGIPESTYHDWRARRVSPSRHELDDAGLLEQIVKVRGAHEFAATYGSPRGWLELRRQGVRVGRKRVERIMREHRLQGAHLRRGWKHGSTRQDPTHTAAPDLVDRQFSAALNHGLRSREVRAGELIHHSDKGAQYTAIRFTQRLLDAGVAPSTGSTGDSYDNALAENLWSTIKVELVYWPGTTFATRLEAEHALLRYIDGWYNPRRIQPGLGGLSPDEYEETHYRDHHR